MSSQEKIMIKFIKNTGATVHQVYNKDRWKWEVLSDASDMIMQVDVHDYLTTNEG